MKTLYFDTFSGISGDMTVGALIDLGLPLEHLREELARLPLEGYSVSSEHTFVNGISAVKFDVDIDATPQHGHRAYRSIREMIDASDIDAEAKSMTLSIFGRLAVAEGRVHGKDPDDVHFHEVGAIDSIVDIVGAAVGFAYFGVEQFLVGSIPLGSGIVRSQHGPIPVPAPATAELLEGFVTRSGDGVGELVTPTGAAIVAALAEEGRPTEMRVERVAYGAGTMVLEDRPNLLRLVFGESVGSATREEVVLIETNIDDGNPEIYEHVMEQLFAAGARDVFFTPIQMKKNRPGTKLSVLGHPADREALGSIVLRETSAIGLRYTAMQRVVMARSDTSVMTAYGEVRMKIATGPNGERNVAPEYEDCRRLAKERGVPLKSVYQAAIAAAGE